jgi:hypothetical protein
MGFVLLGAAFVALLFIAYLIVAAEEGLWPFHRILRRITATPAAPVSGHSADLLTAASGKGISP